jgi:hypothetical protein
MKVADLFASFGLNVDAQSFAKGILAADAVKLALGAVANVARAVTAELKAATFEIIEQGAALGEQSKQLGVSTAGLQSLQYAAMMSGVGVEALNASLGILQKNIVSAVEGNAELKQAFKAIGVTLLDENDKLRSTEAIFQDVAAAFEKMPPSAKRTQLAMQLTGKSGAALIPMYEGLIAAQAEFRDLHGGFSEDFIAEADEFGDNVDRIKTAYEGVKYQIASALLPALMDASQTTLEWVKANKDLIRAKIKEYVEGFVTTVREAYNSVRTWIEANGGLEATLGKISRWLKILAVGFALVKGIGLASTFLTIANAAKVLGLTIRGALIASGIGALVVAIAWAASEIIDNWQDIADFGAWLWEQLEPVFSAIGDAFVALGLSVKYVFVEPFLAAFTAVKDAFTATYDWIVEKITWLERKLEGLVEKVDVFGFLDDTGPSGQRGVALGSGSAFAPVLDTPAAAGSTVISLVNSPTMNLTQQPGEPTIDFERRIVIEQEKAARRMLREALGGLG